MTMLRTNPKPNAASRAGGFSLVELMVAMAIGLVLVLGMASVYLFSKTAFSRQSQLSSIQQGVRTAFEYLGNDARMVGHMGCFTGSAPTAANFFNALSTTAMATNYAVGVEGYEFALTPTDNVYALGSDAPADETDGAKWKTNAASGGISNANMMTALGGGLTPGSDVLVIRTVTRGPVRLTADTTGTGSALIIENISSGTCSTGTAKMSGFCAGSHGLIASCNAARVFAVTSINAGTRTLTLPTGAFPVFAAGTAEVFPMQTIAYYVKRSSSGTTTSLYRRIFNGDPAPVGGVEQSDEQELIQDIESLQLSYGVDTATVVGVVDSYKRAHEVTDWARVVAVRLGLLLRSSTVVAPGTSVSASAPVNGVTVTYPSGSRYDRRVFTTTVAIRNKISYFPPSP